MAQQSFDVIVLVGGGPGGYVCAIRCAKLGMKTAVVERDRMGAHLPELGLHPDQGAAASVRDLAPDAPQLGRIQISTPTILSSTSPRSWRAAALCPSNYPDGVSFLDEEAQDHRHFGESQTGRQGQAVGDQGRQPGRRLHRQEQHRAGDRRAGAHAPPELEPDGKLVWTYRESHGVAGTNSPSQLLVVDQGAIGIEFAGFYIAPLGART